MRIAVVEDEIFGQLHRLSPGTRIECEGITREQDLEISRLRGFEQFQTKTLKSDDEETE